MTIIIISSSSSISINQARIIVTLSWITLQGHFTLMVKTTKRSAAWWSQCYANVSSKSHVFRQLRDVCVCVGVNNDRTIEPFPYIQLNHQIESKSQDYGDVSARNTTRAPNNMQPEITAEKSKKPKRLGKEECFELASESVNGAQVSMLPNGMCVF